MVENNTGIDFAADLAEQIADIASTLVWGAQSVSVVRSDLTRRHEFGETGYDIVIDADLGAPVASFTGSVIPPVTEDVTLDGVECRILESTVGQEGTTWRGRVTNR